MRCSMARNDGSLWYSLQFLNIKKTLEDTCESPFNYHV